ncbi:MAG: ABC transporter ATP-binding protein [Clostridiaceae bacterium]|nr:ABC transporter ATP-binding protein [Eubacteriales bacterium]
MSNVLEVRGLNKCYKEFALKNISFALPQGYIMGFIGPNGAGKTTTIKSILNMVGYESGEITLFGRNVKDVGAALNDRVGVVMDAPFYVNDWTAADVGKAVAPFYTKWDAVTFDGFLNRFHISRTKKLKELSRGMKMKLMAAVALSHSAKLLILDEPTSGLDPVARDELCDLLLEFVSDEQNAVLFSTHITSDLERIADYITFILNGEIVFAGLKEELLERYALVKGGREELIKAQKKCLIGLREYATGFEALAETARLKELPRGVSAEPVSLEELIVFMNKEAGNL